MNHPPEDRPGVAARSGDRVLDRIAQRHHAAALAAMSPPTLARLRASRHAATSSSRRGLGWLLASGSAAVLALAIAMQLQREPVQSTAPLQVAAADAELVPAFANDDYRGLVAGLDENPDLYLWLAANDESLPGATTP